MSDECRGSIGSHELRETEPRLARHLARASSLRRASRGSSRAVHLAGPGLDLLAPPRDVLTAYPVDGGETVHLPTPDPHRLPAGWLADGRLLSFTRFEVPSRVEAFDLRTGKLSPFAVVAPNDPSGVVRISRVHVTPDGRTVLLNHRGMNAVLILLDWSGRRTQGTDTAPAVARLPTPVGR